jgi:1-acyl-sn-glycerol-3-phosphate acyltransferase
MFDSFFHFSYSAPSIIAKKDVGDMLFIGTITRAVQTIFVDRVNKESKRKVMDDIKHRANMEESPAILVYPEGTTTNLNSLSMCLLSMPNFIQFHEISYL